MNLGKLLGAGKSFFGGCGQISYRQNKNIYLPKFNAQKNPFTPKAAESASAAPEIKSRHASGPVRSDRNSNWAAKLNPFRAPEPVRPPAPVAVQVELSLDAVKVVHNDLADADIEVVPVKSRPAAPVETPVLPPARRALGYLSERLLETA